MYLIIIDGNGASASFFWVQPDRSVSISERHQLPVMQWVDGRYSLFAYAIEGLDVLEKLRDGDILLRTQVEDGVWKLVAPDMSFTEM